MLGGRFECVSLSAALNAVHLRVNELNKRKSVAKGMMRIGLSLVWGRVLRHFMLPQSNRGRGWMPATQRCSHRLCC